MHFKTKNSKSKLNNQKQKKTFLLYYTNIILKSNYYTKKEKLEKCLVILILNIRSIL